MEVELLEVAIIKSLMALELVSLETGKKCRLDKHAETVILGRRREWGIADTSVSRTHCTVSLSSRQWEVEVSNNAKPIFVLRRSSKTIITKQPGSRTRMKCGDTLYLTQAETGIFAYGFDILRARPRSPHPPELPLSGIFLRQKFVFLDKSHVKQLRKKVVENGGIVISSIEDDVDYAVVSQDSKESFRDTYCQHGNRCMFVLKEFITDSLADGVRYRPQDYFPFPLQPTTPDRTDRSTTLRQTPLVSVSGIDVREELPIDYDWIEEYNFEKAQETVNKLFTHWTRYKNMPNEALELNMENEDSSEEISNAIDVKAVCTHVACSALSVCFIDQLNQVKGHYHGGKATRFKIKAVDKAIRILDGLSQPLQTQQQLENLKLGRKTTDKLLQIFNSGRVERNVEMEDSERERLFVMFTEVWGAGDSTVQKWIAAGCRSVDDVRRRTDLTEIQRVGLDYYEDFQKRITRSEVIQIFTSLKEHVLSVVARFARKSVRRVKKQVFCCALGSFVRGKREMGDIDILIALPSSLTTDYPLSKISQEILDELLACRLITADLHPNKLRETASHASWMGVCFSPYSRLHRRIDIKVYKRESLPFALNYFIGSQDFVRALRYWCNTPTQETKDLAAKLVRGANGFRLSDQELTLITRIEQRKIRSFDGVKTGPSIFCTTESDIFDAVGLNYVPPWMRMF